jgi:hypothetical protein
VPTEPTSDNNGYGSAPESPTGNVATRTRVRRQPSTSGGGPGDDSPKEMPGPSVKLALIVLLIAVGIVVIGLIAMVSWGSSRPVTAPASVGTAKGSPLKAIPAAPDLAPLVSSGEPPDDIVNSLVLPQGSVPGSVQDDTNSAESYDEQRTFTLLDTPEQKIITFFEVELPAQGWKVVSKGPAKNQPGFEVLAQRAGSDGYYWEVGAVVAPTTFPTSGPAAKTGQTQFEIRLFQVSDSE